MTHLAFVWPDLVIALALVLYSWTGVAAARARARSGIKSPATTGDVMLERALRVQQNTLEQLVAFVPALWLFGRYVEPRLGAALGAVWLVGRVLYIQFYMADPGSRGPAFTIALVPQAILTVGAAIGILVALGRGLAG